MQDKSKNTKEGDQGKSQVTAVDSVSSLMHEVKDLKEFFFFPKGKLYYSWNLNTLRLLELVIYNSQNS